MWGGNGQNFLIKTKAFYPYTIRWRYRKARTTTRMVKGDWKKVFHKLHYDNCN